MFEEALDPTIPVPSASIICIRLLFALVLGFAVVVCYSLTLGYRHNKVRTLSTTLVLLAVMISLVTVVIGDSTARAFGLVGALSIVRFRTVVEDTRDTAFVIFAVIVGMAAGAGHANIGLMSLPVVTLAGWVMSLWDRHTEANALFSGKLTVKISLGLDPHTLLNPVLEKHCERSEMSAAGTSKQGTALEVVYLVQLKRASDLATVVSALHRTEGVQSAELKGE